MRKAVFSIEMNVKKDKVIFETDTMDSNNNNKNKFEHPLKWDNKYVFIPVFCLDYWEDATIDILFSVV